MHAPAGEYLLNVPRSGFLLLLSLFLLYFFCDSHRSLIDSSSPFVYSHLLSNSPLQLAAEPYATHSVCTVLHFPSECKKSTKDDRGAAAVVKTSGHGLKVKSENYMNYSSLFTLINAPT